jgi:ParB/RepB/Spo0J family partition protein
MTEQEKQLELTPIEEIPHEYREIPLFLVGEPASEATKDATDNIRRLGVLQNIILLDKTEGGKYEIVAGNKRVADARAAGKTNVPAMIFPNTLGDAQVAAIKLSENFRRHPSPALEAEALQELIDQGYSQKGLSRQLGISRANIQQRLSLLNLRPRIFEALKAGELRFSVARDLAKLPDDHQGEVIEAMEETGEWPTAKVVAERLRWHKLSGLSSLPFPDWANDPPAEGTTEYMTPDGSWHPMPADRAAYCYAHKDFTPETGTIIQLQVPALTDGMDPVQVGIKIAEAATEALRLLTPVETATGKGKDWDTLSPRAKRYRRAQARQRKEEKHGN